MPIAKLPFGRLPALTSTVALTSALQIAVFAGSGHAQCPPDIEPPDVRVGVPGPVLTLTDGPGRAIVDIVDICELTFTDDCVAPGDLAHGIVDIEAREVIEGGPGYFVSAFATADWTQMSIDIDANRTRPRSYGVHYAVIDNAGRATTVICDLRVVSPNPFPDPCDGIDDDVDGAIDEDFEPVATTCGVGECAAVGATACNAGRVVDMCTAGTPSVELCGTGLDEDCDGEADEGFDVGAPCTVGVGSCARDGQRVCAEDGLGTICDAVPGEPSDELCGSGVDEDCDGVVDEEFDIGAPCTVGVGACARDGSQVCDLSGLSTVCDAIPGEPTEERCETGVDEDCDGAIDEGFVPGLPCSVGLGACLERGVTICEPESNLVVCDAEPAPPSDELCGSGIDEDCDGEADEGFATGQPCFVGLGECRAAGFTVCSPDGLDVVCNAEPGAPGLERCGTGLDEDCDGEIDEGFAIGDACEVGVGACRRDGATMCAANQIEIACDAQPGPPGDELCGTGVDEDCDGLTDEGFDVGVLCTVGVGACVVEGTTVCNPAGDDVVCDAQPLDPGVEQCGSGVDEDCDGLTDEGFDVGSDCTVGLGACETAGTTICNATRDGLDCDAEPGAAETELCGSGIDEDCDGEVDEGFDVGAACVTGIGACARDGLAICAPDGLSTTCDAVAGAPDTELCGSGADEDCDGQIDEGYEVGAPCGVGVGTCRNEGAFVCSEDRLGVECDAVAGAPADELCGTGADEDCDGITDEGFETGAPCTAGLGACEAAGQLVCSEDGTGVVCDAVPGEPLAFDLCGTLIDEDCDGVTDEGWVTGDECQRGSGACRRDGVQICAPDGRRVICSVVAGEPGTELCGNDIDDDCDGSTDEDFVVGEACTSGLGQCAVEGLTACSADGTTLVCDADALEPGVELCGTGLDENCNGQIDDGFGLGEACAAGVGACERAGVMVCTPDQLGSVCGAEPGEAGVELCGTGADEDCDGETDEGFITGLACTSGLGLCEAAGVTVCGADGLEVVCGAEPAPSPTGGAELCDTGLDEDCDGEIDEGFTPGADCVLGLGQCASPGTFRCSDDRRTAICDAVVIEPTVEECNGLDDDCDGFTDELARCEPNWIVFNRVTPDIGRIFEVINRITVSTGWTISIIDPDNSEDVRELVSGDDSGNLMPHWGPEKQEIVFASNRGGNFEEDESPLLKLWVLDRRTDALTQITDGPGHDWTPSWSPNGQSIAFGSTRGAADVDDVNGLNVWAVDADGGNPRRLFAGFGQDEDPVFGADSETVYYMASIFTGGCIFQIWESNVIAGEGSAQPVLDGDGNATCGEDPSVSGDGSTLYYVADRRMYGMDLATRVVTDYGIRLEPWIAPENDRYVFVADFNLYWRTTTGSSQRRITGFNLDFFPRW